MSTTITITIDEAGIYLNNNPIEFPVERNELVRILDVDYIKHKLKYGTVYTWNDKGINAHESDNTVTSLAFSVKHDKMYKFTPKELFTGTITINSAPLTQLPVTKKKTDDDFFSLTIGKNELFISVDELE